MDDTSSDYLEELAALNALGALDGEDLKEFQRLLASGNERLQMHVAEYDEVASLIAPATEPAQPPPPAVKEELMRRIRAAHAIQQGAQIPPRGSEAKQEALSFALAGEGEWLKHPVEGIVFKRLSLNEKAGYATLLLRAEPGVHYPEHHHSGPEECYVIQGDLRIDDHVLGPGDFHHAEPDSHHKVVYTEGGCTLLLVVASADYLPS